MLGHPPKLGGVVDCIVDVVCIWLLVVSCCVINVVSAAVFPAEVLIIETVDVIAGRVTPHLLSKWVSVASIVNNLADRNVSRLATYVRMAESDVWVLNVWREDMALLIFVSAVWMCTKYSWTSAQSDWNLDQDNKHFVKIMALPVALLNLFLLVWRRTKYEDNALESCSIRLLIVVREV